MILVGTLSIEKIVPMNNSLSVQDLIDNGMKVWSLSQQNLRKTLSICVNLNFLNDNRKIVISEKSDREIEECLKAGFNAEFEADGQIK
jgi:hypothetical protein